MNKTNVVSDSQTPCSGGCGSKATVTGDNNEPLCSRCFHSQLRKSASDRHAPLQDLGSDPKFVERHSE